MNECAAGVSAGVSVVSGFQARVTHLHRAVNSREPTLDDFRSVGEIALAEGRKITEKNRASRSYMEGISAFADIERMRDINDKFLHKNVIAVLDVDRLRTLEAEHEPESGHHDLYGDREIMRLSAVSFEDAATDAA